MFVGNRVVTSINAEQFSRDLTASIKEWYAVASRNGKKLSHTIYFQTMLSERSNPEVIIYSALIEFCEES